MFNFPTPYTYCGINPLTYVSQLVTPSCSSSIIGYLAFNKIPENPVITPANTTQVVYPSAKNRYLQSVTVLATTTTP